MPELRRESLRWPVGAFCSLVGALMLVAPHQFAAPHYAVLQSHLPGWGGAFLLAGIALLGVAALAPRRALDLAAHLFAGSILLLLAYGFLGTGAWTASAGYLVLGLGTALAPLLPRTWARGRGAGADLLALVMGLSMTLIGLVILALPEQLSASAYDPARPSLPWYGVVFLGAGLALTWTQLHPSPPAVLSRTAHLLAAAALFAFLVGIALPSRAWLGILYHGGFGSALALLPWLGPRLQRVDSASLRTRLALALAAAAALPLIVGVALGEVEEERSTVDQALALQQTLAAELAQDVADYIGLHRAALIILATQPGLLDLAPEAQQARLRTVNRAYPAFVALSTFDASGKPLARSDDRPLVPGADFRAFQEARRTGASTLDILIGPLIQRPVFAFGVPVRAADERFAGLVVGVLESERLAGLLAAGPGLREDMRTYLVDSAGRAIAHPDAALAASFADLSAAPPVAALLAGAEVAGAVAYEQQARGWLAGYASVPDLGWGMVVERPAAAVLASTRAWRDLHFGILLLAIGLAAAGGVATAGWLVAPLRLLALAARDLGAGRAAAPLPSSHISEIGHLAAVFGDMRDHLAERTAERERAEAALRQSEAQYRTLVDLAPDVVYGISAEDGTLSAVNPAFEQLTGWPPADWLGRHFMALLHPDDVPRAAAAFGQVLRGESPPPHELRVRARSGDYLVGEFRSVPNIERGRVVGVFGIARDVTARKRAEEALQARARTLHALHDLAVAASGVLDPTALARLAVDHARDLLGTDSAALHWWDVEAEVLRGLAHNDPRAATPFRELQPGEGIMGQAFQRCVAVVVEDYPDWEGAVPPARARGIRSGAAVPLLANERALGTLGVYSYAPCHFGAEHLQTLSLLAAQVGPALEAARLHTESERRRAEAEALAELARQGATERDTERVVGLICQQACRLVGASYAAVSLTEADGTRSWRGMWGNRSDAWRRMGPLQGRGPSEVALQTGQTVVIERLHEHPEFQLAALHQREGGRTALATPLPGRERVLGTLVLGWRSEATLGAAQVRLAEALAGYAATIIDNAHAHAALTARAAELAAAEEWLRSLYEAMACGVLVRDASGTIVYANAAAQAALGLPLDAMRGRFPEVLWPMADEDGSDLTVSGGPGWVALRTGRAVRKMTVRLTRPEGEQRWLQVDAVPLFGEDGQATQAVSSFIDITERKEAEDERARLLAREQAARAEAEAAQQRLAFLAEATSALTNSLDYETTLQSVARLAVPSLADHCLVDLLQEDGSLGLVAVAHVNPSKEALLREMRHRWPPDPEGPHPVARVLRTGETEFIPDVCESLLESIVQDAEHLESAHRLGDRSLLVAPLVARGRTLGVITFGLAESGRQYSSADLALAEDLARRCALAIDNARLYAEAQRALRFGGGT